MTFPFSYSRTIVLNQQDYQISSESYLLNYIEANLDWLDMKATKKDEKQILFRKTDILNAFRTKDYLRLLIVKVDIGPSEINIELQTETILIFLFGVALFLFGLFTQFPLIGGIIGALIFWSIGFGIKALALSKVYQNLEKSLNLLVR